MSNQIIDSMIEDHIEKLIAGNMRSLAKLITFVENREPGYQEVVDRIYHKT